ncbi:MAG: hypothetical protein IJ242_16570 [Clostridia bacterium]|nr:hypothetical protein [Clostridia bacterium]
MMNTKNWCRLTVSLLLAFIIFCVTVVCIIDPFQIYHLAKWYIPPIDKTTQVYSNAGIVKNYSYDSAIVGTSVTENFHPTYMDTRLGGHFIKLCTSAGTVHNHAVLLQRAFDTHSMNHIVYGLDIYSLVGASDKLAYALPDYLYTDTVLDDAQYWFNRTVWGSFLPKCLKTWGRKQEDSIRDQMYNWAGQDDYGPVAMYNAVFDTPDYVYNPDAFLEQARLNLEINLLPFIKSHPETSFDIFFPPYSAAEWSNMESKGTLEALLSLRLLCFDVLSPYNNVALFDFSARDSWVLNINNYKDTTHYGEWINDEITDCIADADGSVSERSVIECNNEKLRSWAHALHEAGYWIFNLNESL